MTTHDDLRLKQDSTRLAKKLFTAARPSAYAEEDLGCFVADYSDGEQSLLDSAIELSQHPLLEELSVVQLSEILASTDSLISFAETKSIADVFAMVLSSALRVSISRVEDENGFPPSEDNYYLAVAYDIVDGEPRPKRYEGVAIARDGREWPFSLVKTATGWRAKV